MLISRRQLAAMAASLRMQLTSLVSSPLMLDRLPHSHLAYRIRVTVRVRGAAMAIANSPRIEAVGEERLPRPPKPYIPIPTNLDTIVVEPKGKHKATIVWLHGLGQSGSKCAADIESYRELQHPHIKWILPTAPLRNVDLREGLVTAWYNATPIFKEGHFIDLEGLDKTAERVVNILLKEQPEDGEKKVKVVVGGFSQGCATALYITKCSFLGKYSNGNPFPLNLDAAMAFGGWMPTIKTLEEEVNAVPDARQRAGEIPMFFGHCEDDKIMPSRQMGLAISAFQNVGANNITSKTYSKGGHSFTAEEAADVLKWLVATLDLETLEEADETPDFMEVKDPVNEEETGGPDENVTISECSEQQSMMPIDGQHTDCSITVV